MTISPHLYFNGQCEEAFKFYAKLLNGQIVTMITYSGSPAQSHVPEQWRNKILHAALSIAGQTIMAADAPPDRYQLPQGFSVGLHVPNSGEAERIFKALSENGSAQMPLQKTFWSPAFAMLTDRFGIPWMINTEQPVT